MNRTTQRFHDLTLVSSILMEYIKGGNQLVDYLSADKEKDGGVGKHFPYKIG